MEQGKTKSKRSALIFGDKKCAARTFCHYISLQGSDGQVELDKIKVGQIGVGNVPNHIELLFKPANTVGDTEGRHTYAALGDELTGFQRRLSFLRAGYRQQADKEKEKKKICILWSLFHNSLQIVSQWD